MLFNFLLKTISAAFLIITDVRAAVGSLEQVTNFGSNPTNVGMFVYKPAKLANPPPLIVGIHWCTGTAQAFFSGTLFATLADTYGFIVIYPNAPDSVSDTTFYVYL